MHPRFVVVLFAVTAVVCLAAPVVAESPIAIDARRELLVDDYLIDRFDGRAELRLHQPTPREIVLLFNEPWEGNSCGAYHTVLRDGDRYRMYYIACQQTLKGEMASHPIFTCYAESNDGVHWVKPELGQFEFAGSKKNNIIMWKGYDRDSEAIIVPFKDANPACQPEQRYKAMVNIHSSLHALQSSDGIHWSEMSDKAVITKGAFDSQNLAFWDATRHEYRAYACAISATACAISARQPRPTSCTGRSRCGSNIPGPQSSNSTPTGSLPTIALRTCCSAFPRATPSAVGTIRCGPCPSWSIVSFARPSRTAKAWR